MNLNIKHLFLLLCLGLTTFTFAQETEGTTKDITQDDHYGIFKIGYYNPIAFGDNFANKGMEQKGGVEFSFLANLYETGFLVGLQYNYFRSNVTDKELVGAYTRSSVHSIGPLVGYQFLFKEKWRANVVAGVGATSYNNTAPGDKFNDSATTLWVIPTVTYHFNKVIGIYLSSSYRKDFTGIQAPAELNSFFKSANYVSFSLGLHIVI